jgi:hypothetical protein
VRIEAVGLTKEFAGKQAVDCWLVGPTSGDLNLR